MSRANPCMPYGTRSGISGNPAHENLKEEPDDDTKHDVKMESPNHEQKAFCGKRATEEQIALAEHYGSDSDLTDIDEPPVEESGVALDEAILHQVKLLTTRTEVLLAKEERCWYELESPYVRNKRPDFLLKVELDVIDTVKAQAMREILEVLKEVSIHYADAVNKVVKLTEEVSQYKKQLGVADDAGNNTPVAKHEDPDIDMDFDLKSVADSLDELALAN